MRKALECSLYAYLLRKKVSTSLRPLLLCFFLVVKLLCVPRLLLPVQASIHDDAPVKELGPTRAMKKKGRNFSSHALPSQTQHNDDGLLCLRCTYSIMNHRQKCPGNNQGKQLPLTPSRLLLPSPPPKRRRPTPYREHTTATSRHCGH